MLNLHVSITSSRLCQIFLGSDDLTAERSIGQVLCSTSFLLGAYRTSKWGRVIYASVGRNHRNVVIFSSDCIKAIYYQLKFFASDSNLDYLP